MSKSHLVEHQAQNRLRTVALIDSAMATIEEEVRSLGYYPDNNGRVTIKEVCRKAGVSYSTLKNNTHLVTIKRVRNWLNRMKKVAPTAKVDAESVKRARVKELVEQVQTIARNFNRFKIEYDMILSKNAELQDKVAELEAEQVLLVSEMEVLKRLVERAEFLTKGQESNVIPFPDLS